MCINEALDGYTEMWIQSVKGGLKTEVMCVKTLEVTQEVMQGTMSGQTRHFSQGTSKKMKAGKGVCM